MAYNIEIVGAYSGRPNHTLHLYVRRNAVSGNSSQYAWELYARRNSGPISWGLDCKPWQVGIAYQSWSGCHNLDFRSGIDRITLASGVTDWYGHDANGNLSFWVDAWHNTAPQVIGNADPPAAILYTDRIPKPPNAPSLGTPTNVTTSSFRVPYTVGLENGAVITQTQVQWATDPGFSQVVWTDNIKTRASGYSEPAGAGVVLTPGRLYYVRARSEASPYGWSGWSNTVSQTTLPAVAPGMAVSASPSGVSATVVLTPPGGVTGVTSYTIERRVQGSSTITKYSAPNSPYVVTGLTPGTTYEWRASAFIGSYQSPSTGWLALRQPSPNTTPGQYFDGSTPATPDQTYSWTGIVNGSISQARGRALVGWVPFSIGNVTTGATGIVSQVTGGVSGGFAARTIFWSDQTVPGYQIGAGMSPASMADVTPGATYVGSIHVNPSKSTRGQAVLGWYTSAGAYLSESPGTAAIVVPETFTRFMVTGVAPAGAEYASVVWRDVVGDGHSPWLGGDSIMADAAMITLTELFPYFDGSTPDSNEFDYGWMGTEHASVSTRTQRTTSLIDPLADPDCETVPAPPRPPTVPSDCIVDIGEWRRYWATIPATEVSDWLTVIPTLELETAAYAARQVRIRMYANPFGYSSALLDTSDWCSEQIISYIPPTTLFTLDGVTQRAWAEVSGAPARSADHLLYGSNGTPATWPQLSCGISYLVSFDVPLDAPEDNVTPRVYLTQRTG
jgi:hypothetical protein